MVNAHDLLWGMTPAHLPADAPAWVLDALSAGHPVVCGVPSLSGARWQWVYADVCVSSVLRR